jgi:Secretion system C-terminal sorting domain/PA domain
LLNFGFGKEIPISGDIRACGRAFLRRAPDFSGFSNPKGPRTGRIQGDFCSILTGCPQRVLILSIGPYICRLIFLILIKIVMKKSNQALRYFWGAFLCVVFCQNAFAQTDESSFIVRFTDAQGKSVDYIKDANCSFIGALRWGGLVNSDVVGEAVWAKDLVGNDSLACDSIRAGALTGKIAVIRRGACNFTDKALKAKRAGAIAIITVMDNRLDERDENGNVIQTVDDCSTGLMGGGDEVAELAKFPAIFMPRAFGKAFDAALKTGKVNIGFLIDRFRSATAAFHYATPLSQVDTLDWISVVHANRTNAPQTNVQFKVEITAPNGVKTTLQRNYPTIGPLTLGPNGEIRDTFVRFPPYAPPAVKGKFKAVFSNSLYKERRDTLTRFFEITDYTWATDDLKPTGGIGLSGARFAEFGNFVQSAGICWTGDKPNPKATHVTFGLSNASAVFNSGNTAANRVTILVYNAAAFGLDGSFDDIGDDLIASGFYDIKGNESATALIDVPLEDIENNKSGVALETNFPYYVSIRYQRPDNAPPAMPLFLASAGVGYIDFNGLPSTPLELDRIYTGWSGATLVQRMQLDGYKPSVGVESFSLERDRLKVGPIPAADQMTLQFDLEKPSKNVYVSISDIQGRTYLNQRFQNVQNTTESIDVKGIPSGHYVLIVHTDEGSTARKVTVCH